MTRSRHLEAVAPVCIVKRCKATTASNSRATTMQSPSFSQNIVQAAVTLKCCQTPRESWLFCKDHLSYQISVVGWRIRSYFSLHPILLCRRKDSLVVDQFCNSSTSTPQTAVAPISGWKQQNCRVSAGFFGPVNTFSSKPWLRAYFRILAMNFILPR